MSGWWELLPLFQKVLWVIAVPASVLTILQVLMEIIGFGGDTDTDVGADGDINTDGDHGDGMHIFTVKGMIIFFTAFAWIGLAGVNAGLAAFIASLIGGVTGIAFMFLFAWIFYALSKLSEDGTVQIKNALYQNGEVYLKIPAGREAHGKVIVKIQGHLRELDALTDGEEIPTGTRIQVIDVIDSATVLVAKDQ